MKKWFFKRRSTTNLHNFFPEESHMRHSKNKGRIVSSQLKDQKVFVLQSQINVVHSPPAGNANTYG